jgi:hypothetical protein
LHCQLVEVEPTLRLGAFDDNILEVGEVDSGLTWAKAGYSMWFTPSSVVHYRLSSPIAAEDIRLFEWRWNMRSIRKGYLYFLARLLGAMVKSLQSPRRLLSNLQGWRIGYFDWPASGTN